MTRETAILLVPVICTLVGGWFQVRAAYIQRGGEPPVLRRNPRTGRPSRNGRYSP
jgi:hypothetical protein